MIVPGKNRQVRLSKLGKDDNILINQDTGEILGTHVTTLKVFSVLIWAVQYSALSKDEVDLDLLVLEAFTEANKDKEPPLMLSPATFRRGINELEKAQIVAKTLRQGRYFINPNFVFNGDRIAFTTLIERRKSAN